VAVDEEVEVQAALRRKAFTAFAHDIQDRLRHALVAAYGLDAGRDAAADALIYGWEHWDRIRQMDNPAGYLYRVGQRKAKRRRHREALLPEVPDSTAPWVEPKLPAALSRLSRMQRVVVVLVHGYDVSHREAAGLLGISRGTVQRHLERGLARLRTELGVDDA
jgi:RNA polymerase sigma-70 factor (ECF subfamily)